MPEPPGPQASPSRPLAEAGSERYQPLRPYWPDWRTKDARPVDRTIVEVPVTEQLVKTKKGLCRASSGVVRYSAVHGVKFRADAEELLYIMRRQLPANCKVWSVWALEKAYQASSRRHGSWARYNLSLQNFLSLFPRTFELFGAQEQFVRPLRSTVTSVADGEEEVMKRLALARHSGVVHSHTPVEGVYQRQAEANRPDIQQNRAKAWYVPSSNPSSRRSSRPTSASGSCATRPTSATTSSRPSRPASAGTHCSSGFNMYKPYAGPGYQHLMADNGQVYHE